MTYTPLVFKHVRDNVRYLKGNYCEIYFKKNCFFTFDKSVRNSKNKSKGDGHTLAYLSQWELAENICLQ